jgi:ABC-2 type transport system ATP-binding protein
MNLDPIIKVCRLSKRFGPVTALDDISFSVKKGEIFGLLGPNGAGKTTTIHMLLGLVTHTAGDVEILKLKMPGKRREILQRINFSSAYISLPPNLTVRENLTIFSRLYGIARPLRKIGELLETFEIEETVNRVTGSLSSGQLTRLNLCKSFLNDPEVLFLDEPTASLDPDIAAKVRDRLLRLQQERQVSMIYTSHHMDEIEVMCDRVIFLSHGRIIMEGGPREMTRRAEKKSLEELFIAIARNGGLPENLRQEGGTECGSMSAP